MDDDKIDGFIGFIVLVGSVLFSVFVCVLCILLGYMILKVV